MSVLADRPAEVRGGPPATRQWRGLLAARSWFWPVLVTTANAVAFYFLRPGVNDLWAARARASAVDHGVGLFYWFSWFGGGSTPGNYSVVTPYLSALIGTEFVAAASAVAAATLAWAALRDTRLPVAATAFAVAAVLANLWSGRVPFLLGGALGLAALLAVRARRPGWVVGLTVATIAASPVSGAFLVLGLSGTFLTGRTREWRPIICWAAGTVVVLFGVVALTFGAPGPEPFTALLAGEVVVGLVLARLARPADHVRTTVYVAAAATVVLFFVPNSMGGNLARFVWFCLPALVLATATRPVRRTAILLLPLILVGAAGTVTDLVTASRPAASASYYQPLARELGRIGDLPDYRLEVVDQGSHAAYDLLLGHAVLARGWETQADVSLNATLDTKRLGVTAYRDWLDDNAVGYVALPVEGSDASAEYRLVRRGLPYLEPMWSTPQWRLFRVTHPRPVVARPATVAWVHQSAMAVDVPCACRVPLRIRFSPHLVGTRVPVPAASTGRSPVLATVQTDSQGWTVLGTPRPGRYVLRG